MDELMNLTEIAKEIHENAVAHGWWEEDRPAYEIIALIHSEWSEALEEYRAGRPMVYEGEGGKPEGIAVELIDGVIRILDYLASREDVGTIEFSTKVYMRSVELPELIAFLHSDTTMSWFSAFGGEDVGGVIRTLVRPIQLVFLWIAKQGLDPLEILREKHEYNKTRPYRHGGKVC